jgi:hypothetical protein
MQVELKVLIIMVARKGRDRGPGGAPCILNTVLYAFFADILFTRAQQPLEEC